MLKVNDTNIFDTQLISAAMHYKTILLFDNNRALRCEKYEKVFVSKRQIKTYTRRIFNTLENHFCLLELLTLLVAVDIHLNLCPGSF